MYFFLFLDVLIQNAVIITHRVRFRLSVRVCLPICFC